MRLCTIRRLPPVIGQGWRAKSVTGIDRENASEVKRQTPVEMLTFEQNGISFSP